MNKIILLFVGKILSFNVEIIELTEEKKWYSELVCEKYFCTLCFMEEFQGVFRQYQEQLGLKWQ